MSKVLFLYNDLNSVTGISEVMGVVERYARNSDNGVFKVSTRPNPSVKFENGSSILVLPVSMGIENLSDFDKVYVDESIDLIVDTSRFNNKVELYDSSSFPEHGNGGN